MSKKFAPMHMGAPKAMVASTKSYQGARQPPGLSMRTDRKTTASAEARLKA